MQYQGYIGVVDYDPDVKRFHGRVINTRDVITFEGETAGELERALAESIDDYRAMCAEEGVDPQKPLSGKFVVRIPPELHQELVTEAARTGRSLNAVVREALESRVHTLA
jgi:predicted HicB family RNase H-like nuclease